VYLYVDCLGIPVASPTILFAETDHRTLDILPRTLSDHIPHLTLDICTSTDELSRKLGESSYDAVAVDPLLIQDYLFLRHKKARYSLAPLIIIAGQGDRILADKALARDAFDLIVKPLVPRQAAQTVKLALWHHGLLRLLASKERAASRFREHMEAFPHDLKAETEFMTKLSIYERTHQALTTSLQLLLNIEEESTLFDMAASVESVARKQVLDRLLTLCREGPTHGFSAIETDYGAD